MARTFAILEDAGPQTLAKVAGKVSKLVHDPVDQIHYLIVLSRLAAPRNAAVTGQVATALLALDETIHKQKLNIDSNWPPRLQELYGELARKDATLNAVLLMHKEFGRPGVMPWLRCHRGLMPRRQSMLS